MQRTHNQERETQSSKIMDVSSPTEYNLKSSRQLKIGTQASKKRKMDHKVVVTVRAEANVGKQKGEGPPPDFWSWRKYGQKPIKGSPYPRGYYKCSTSKGCSARKQVERCKTDGSVFIITYTCDHNHPGPDLLSISPTNPPLEGSQSNGDGCPTSTSPKQPIPAYKEGPNSEALSFLSPPNCLQESTQQDPLTEVKKTSTQDNLITLLEEGRTHICTNSMDSSSAPAAPPKLSEENDFFDELEELPIPPSFTSLVRSSFFDERVLHTTQTTFS